MGHKSGPPPTLHRLNEVAQRLGIHKTTLAGYILRGQLEGVRVGHYHFLTDDQVAAAERFLATLRASPRYQQNLKVLEHARSRFIEKHSDAAGTHAPPAVSMPLLDETAPPSLAPSPADPTDIVAGLLRLAEAVERIADAVEELATRPVIETLNIAPGTH